MRLYTITLTRIPQDVAIEQVVIMGEKIGVTVVPPMNDMTGNARQIHPWFARHRDFLSLVRPSWTLQRYHLS